MKFRKYRVIVEADREGREFLGIAVPAINKKKAEEFVAGNGRIVAVEDITEDFPISVSKVVDALRDHNFGETEIDLIMRTLELTEIAEWK